MPKRLPGLNPKKVRGPDIGRLSAYRRGYDKRWAKIRKLVLAECPLCQDCKDDGLVVAATDVDHIVPLARGGTHDRSNLRPLCHACHSSKTAKHDGGLGKQRS